MPEAYAYSPEAPKKPAIIKVSCGIGDTDGFPAFDVDSDAYASKDDVKWGFLITGGGEFHMPLTVFQVTPNGLADKGGIRLGDIILEINEEDATQYTLAQAHEKIDATGKKLLLLVKSMEDDEADLEGYEPGEEKTIVLRVPKPMPPPKVAAASIEARLMAMQRKLSEIAEIPKILSSTLATVSQTFDKLMPLTEQQQLQLLRGNAVREPEQQLRKYSYDEDAVDYELSDDNNNDDGDDDDDDDDDEGDSGNGAVSRQFADCSKVKDVTPESDYASEVNYMGNEADGADEVDDELDEDADDYDYVEHYTQHSTNAEGAHFNAAAAVGNDGEEEEDDDDDEDEEDFLSTTYTWNFRNVPKLQLNDEKNESVVIGGDDEKDGDDEVIELSRQAKKLKLHAAESPQQQQAMCKEDTKEKHQEKLDKFERSWPWADREKIIYKQSTCHLVRRKPLGLVEQRIQLLAKQHILDNLQQMNRPK